MSHVLDFDAGRAAALADREQPKDDFDREPEIAKLPFIDSYRHKGKLWMRSYWKRARRDTSATMASEHRRGRDYVLAAVDFDVRPIGHRRVDGVVGMALRDMLRRSRKGSVEIGFVGALAKVAMTCWIQSDMCDLMLEHWRGEDERDAAFSEQMDREGIPKTAPRAKRRNVKTGRRRIAAGGAS